MTFDEWFKQKYGESFDEIYFIPGEMIGDYMREYVSEMAQS